MSFEGPSPVPEPQDLPEFAHRETKELRDRAPVVEVSNEVIWTNPDIQAPFDMKEGEPTKLGVFISNEDQERTIGTVEGHGRSGILGKVIFGDKEGRRFRDVDAKGIGHVRYNLISGHVEAGEFYDATAGPYASAGRKDLGLMDRAVAIKDASMAEELLARGIRTYRVIGITKLNELIAQDQNKEEKISIAEAKERKMIAEDMEPVVEVRAFGTRARVQDMNEPGNLSDAMELVRQEFGFPPEQFQMKEFLHWYAETLGTNIGRLHRQKFTHGFLTSHNLTLDCRIVDLDSIKTHDVPPNPDFILSQMRVHESPPRSAQEEYAKDLQNGHSTLSSLDYSFVLDDIYMDAYQKALQEKDPPPLPDSVKPTPTETPQ